MKRAFIDYYNKEGILPVKQNISDPRFLETRSFLYSRLGAPLRFLKGIDIIEFGPGGGFNAIATSQYKPGQYYFIEGSTLGIEQLNEFVKRKLIRANKVKIYNSNFLDFNIEKKFDLVIAEGCIPGQIDPQKYLEHISTFVNNEGLIIITTISKSSVLSEMLRSLYALLIKDSYQNHDTYLDFLEKEFASHLSNLGTNTRSVKDWVLDNILNSCHKDGVNFSLLDAAKVLSKFEFVSSSPTFFMDLTWYKKYKFNHSVFIKKMGSQTSRFELFLLDSQLEDQDLLLISNREALHVLNYIEYSFDEIFRILSSNLSEINLDRVYIALENLVTALPPEFNKTKSGIIDFMHFLKSEKKVDYKFTEFKSFWGRGQQYVSFRRIE
jgi:SAM-dependent methyltransferase